MLSPSWPALARADCEKIGLEQPGLQVKFLGILIRVFYANLRKADRGIAIFAQHLPDVLILYSADLHYALPQFDWLGRQVPRFDLAVLGGDLLDLGSDVDLEVQEMVVKKYLRRFSGERMLLVSSGNHDIHQLSPSGERAAVWMEELDGARLRADYGSYEREGVLFTICPWWDGPETRARAERALEVDAARPKKSWIWIHHNPPAGTPVAWTGKSDGGDPVVVEWIRKYEPDLVFSGHIHNAPYLAKGAWNARIGRSWIFIPSLNYNWTIIFSQ